MTLAQAFDLLSRSSAAKPPFGITLACGFTPLYLETFLAAHLGAALPAKNVRIETGLFGDLAGTLEDIRENADAVAIALEWADLDPRLGYRSFGGWGASQESEYPSTVRQALTRLRFAIERIPSSIPVAISGPTLPFAPAFAVGSLRAGACELQLRCAVSTFLAEVGKRSSVAVVNEARLLGLSPAASRFDPRAEVLCGSPYTISHASALAESLACLIAPAPLKKGVITDLDNTLWAGIAGEIGAESLRWDLSAVGHRHGLYQQLLQALASQGVLIGAASKNDPAIAAGALTRSDLLLRPQAIFPVEANWKPKSKSVGRILGAWNVGPESVIFIDDDPAEVAEVKAAWPEMDCLLFPSENGAGAIEFFCHLRGRFGKNTLTPEDTLRVESLRSGSLVQHRHGSEEAFLEQAQAEISAEFDPPFSEPRILELVNKTNQFNLNGTRYSEAEWARELSRAGAFAVVVSYRDRFGPLGRIAVLRGIRAGATLEIGAWVMSCRAFSRRIEHQCLKLLFDCFGAAEIRLNFLRTARNGPLAETLQMYTGSMPEATVIVSRESFQVRAPRLYQKVEVRNPPESVPVQLLGPAAQEHDLEGMEDDVQV